LNRRSCCSSLPLGADAGCGVKISDSQESIRPVVQAAGKASTICNPTFSEQRERLHDCKT
jgi:hypothetical protein